MDVKNAHSVTKTEISVFGRQAFAAERRRSPSLADKVLMCRCRNVSMHVFSRLFTTDLVANDCRVFDWLGALTKK